MDIESELDDDLISTKEAAKILTVSNHHTLEIWRLENNRAIKNGRPKPRPDLQHAKIGGAIRYYRKSLIDYIKKNTIGGEH